MQSIISSMEWFDPAVLTPNVKQLASIWNLSIISFQSSVMMDRKPDETVNQISFEADNIFAFKWHQILEWHGFPFKGPLTPEAFQQKIKESAQLPETEKKTLDACI